ncbi:MAG: hypothetical protein ABTQ31_13460 [Rhizobiaceae bacterium]
MGADGDRAERAGNFVRGLMDEAERERAQRDLEIDPQFRDAVLDAVGRMRAEGPSTQEKASPADSWGDIAARLAALPQMQAKAATAPRPQPGEPRVTFGRRKTDFMPMPQLTRRPVTAAAMPGSLWRAAVLALAITCAFLFGYIAGVHSAGGPAAVSVTTER